MNTTTLTPARLVLSPEVEAFAKERGLAPYLPALAETLQRVFAEARCLKAEIEEDPEIANLRHLLFSAEVPWPTYEQARLARNLWYQETADVCPAPLLCEFRLHIDRRPE